MEPTTEGLEMPAVHTANETVIQKILCWFYNTRKLHHIFYSKMHKRTKSYAEAGADENRYHRNCERNDQTDRFRGLEVK